MSYDVSDEVNSDIDQLSEKAKGAAKGVAKNTAKSAAKSVTRKVAKKGTKAAGKIGSKAVIKSSKMAGAAVKTGGRLAVAATNSVIAFVAAFWIPIAIILAIVAGIYLVFNITDIVIKETNYNEPAEDGSYQTEVDSGALEDEISLLYYLRYAEDGYFYTVDDATEIKQGDNQQLVTDFAQREEMFKVSPSTIMLLDNMLNQSGKLPEQFIKPVYNTCSKAIIDGDTDFSSKCETLPLVIDNDMQVMSTKYDLINEQKGGLLPNDLPENYMDNVYVKTNELTEGIWDWGLAPIFHYKSYEEESKVTNYLITDISIYDPSTRKSRKMKYSDYANNASLTSEYSEQYVQYSSGFELKHGELYDDAQDTEASDRIPETVTKHGIDSVASYVGNLSLPFTTNYEFVDKFEVIDFVEKEFVGKSIPSDYGDPNYEICSNVVSESASGCSLDGGGWFKYANYEEERTPTQQESDSCRRDATSQNENHDPTLPQEIFDQEKYNKCISDIDKKPGWAFCDSGNCSQDSGDTFRETRDKDGYANLFYSKWTEKLAFSKSGALETVLPIYESNIDDGEITGTKYLEDYIDNYQVYSDYKYTLESGFKCVGGPDVGLLEAYDTLESAYTRIEDMGISSNPGVFFNTTSSDNVPDPSFCLNNEIAVSINNTSMEKFYFDDMSYAQKALIASMLDLTIDDVEGDDTGFIGSTSDVTGLFYKGVGVSTDNISETQQSVYGDANKSVYDLIVKEAATYGVDSRLLLNIVALASGGDDNTNIGNDCMNDINGCGLSGIRIWEDLDRIAVQNFDTGENESFIVENRVTDAALQFGAHPKRITSETLSDPEFNIKISAAYLQYLTNKYRDNMAIVIEAFHIGEENMYNVLKINEKKTDFGINSAIGKKDNLEWTRERGSVSNIKKEYLESILSAYPLSFSKVKYPKKATFFERKDYKYWDFSALRIDANFKEATSGELAEQRLFEKISELSEEELREIWDYAFMNQKNYDIGKYSIVDGIDGLNNPEFATHSIIDMDSYDRTVLIQAIFAFNDGVAVDELNDLTEMQWKSKIMNTFMNSGSKEWKVKYNMDEYFPNGLIDKSPTKGDIQISNYGYVDHDENDERIFNDSINIKTESGSDVDLLSISKGEVVALSNEDTPDLGKYITINYNPEGVCDDTNEGNDGCFTEVTFFNLASTDLNVGDIVETEDVIGKVNGSTGVYSAHLLINGMEEDFGNVLDSIQEKIEELLFDYEAMTTNAKQNEDILKELQILYDSGAFDDWNNCNQMVKPIDSATRFTTGSWKYGGNTGGGHQAMDIGGQIQTQNLFGTPINAVCDAVVTNYGDNNPDEVQDPSYNNRIWYMFNMNGMTYGLKVSHIKQGGVTDAAKSVIVGQGETVALVGKSGATWPHAHLELFRIGEMSMKEAVGNYLENPDVHWGAGWGISNGVVTMNTVCEMINNPATQGACRERPECFFGWIDGNKSPWDIKSWQVPLSGGSNVNSCAGYKFDKSYSN